MTRRLSLDRRPVLLGEAPSKSGDRYHHFPLSGAVGQRLCEMAGIEPDSEGSRYGRYYWALLEHFECLNLIERYPGERGRGASFPVERARESLLGLLDEIPQRVVVVLGKRLLSLFQSHDPALTQLDGRFYYWQPWAPVVGEPVSILGAIPHPSGLNRMYNAEEERGRAGAMLREALRIARPDAEEVVSSR